MTPRKTTCCDYLFFLTILAIYQNPNHDVSLYILDRISQALNVSICDLIEQTPDKD